MIKGYSYIGAVIRTSVCVAALLSAPIAFGAPPASGAPPTSRQQAQAQLLDHAEILCSNCFFGPSDYYYCFSAGNQILVGYQNTPVLNWEDQSKNYLTGVHHAWTAWAAPGQTVPIRYDDKHIWVDRAESKPVTQGIKAHVKAVANWVSRGNAKQVKLTRTSMRDIFNNNSPCWAAAKPKAH